MTFVRGGLGYIFRTLSAVLLPDQALMREKKQNADKKTILPVPSMV